MGVFDFNMITYNIYDNINIDKKFEYLTQRSLNKFTRSSQCENYDNKIYSRRGQFFFVLNLTKWLLKNVVPHKVIKFVKRSKLTTQFSKFLPNIHLKV